jgi:hypothetical protein
VAQGLHALAGPDPDGRPTFAASYTFVEPVVGLGAALATKRNPSPMLASHEYVDGQERGHQHVRHIYCLGDAKIHCHAA